MSDGTLSTGESLADGRFAVLELLGRGGYGEVYACQQVSMKRSVAVKVLRTQLLDDASVLQRFQNEARFACQLTHPNTVVYHDFGWDDDRQLMYLVMEFIDGTDVSRWIKAHGPMRLDRVVGVLEQVTGSLQEAHDLGLVHRDIKPGNLMLVERAGRDDFVKVIDFGIAKALKPVFADHELRRLTRSGVMIGSPAFMAPEQILNEEGLVVGPAADIYALGCVAFTMLTGLAPFRGKTPMEVATRHIVDAPPSLTSVAGGMVFSSELEALMERWLAKSPDDRPPSADALFEELLAATANDIRAMSGLSRLSSGIQRRLADMGPATEIDPLPAVVAKTDPAHRTSQRSARHARRLVSRQQQGLDTRETSSPGVATDEEPTERPRGVGLLTRLVLATVVLVSLCTIALALGFLALQAGWIDVSGGASEAPAASSNPVTSSTPRPAALDGRETSDAGKESDADNEPERLASSATDAGDDTDVAWELVTTPGTPNARRPGRARPRTPTKTISEADSSLQEVIIIAKPYGVVTLGSVSREPSIKVKLRPGTYRVKVTQLDKSVFRTVKVVPGQRRYHVRGWIDDVTP